MKPNFSVVLIARNESKTLPLLMSSLKEFRARGGEIVLVDTGSSDDTAELARGIGCKVIEVGDRFRRYIDTNLATQINEKFCVNGEGPVVNGGDSLFDYAAARNFAASLASNDMVAMPDCDEQYTKLDLDAITEKISAGIEQFEYNFVFSHDAEGNDLIKFTHCKFYNRTKQQWVGVIHEVLSGDAKKEFLPESIIKLEHWQNPETNRSGYLKGLAYDCFLNPENDRNSHYFAREMFYKHMYNSALKEFERHVAMNAWPTERSESLNYMGRCHIALHRREKGLGCFVRALDIEPTRREPLMHMAEMYYRERNADLAIIYAAAALQIKGNLFYANYQPYYEYLPHEILYWALWQKGEYNASKRHFDICLAYKPFSSQYLHDFRWYYTMPKLRVAVPRSWIDKKRESSHRWNYPEDRLEFVEMEELSRDGDFDWLVVIPHGIQLDPDCIVSAFKQAMDNNKLFMAFGTDGPVGPYMISKKLLVKVGERLDGESVWNDVSKLGHAMRSARAHYLNHNS